MNHGTKPIGVLIESGASNWQIFQQDAAGRASFRLAGRWITTAKFTTATVLVRVLHESTYEAVAQPLRCLRAITNADGTWSLDVTGVPRGGLYRIETVLQIDNSPVEWSARGDMVHHIGVGDLWVIAGQSNSAGYGKTPVNDPPQLGLHMFHACGEWRLATHPLGDSTGSKYPANREGANASHSPYLAFARQLELRLGYPIGLIPAALGGSAILSWDRKDDGHLFTNMLAYIKDATAGAITTAPRVTGMLWYQGESDAGPQQHPVYLERFTRMIADFRSQMGGEHLPVITCQLNRVLSPRRVDDGNLGWEAIREIQRQAARVLHNVHVVSTLDLGLSDSIHIDSAGNLVIGHRMAAAALATRYGFDVRYKHPDLRHAKKTGDRSITLVFNNIDERIHYENQNVDQIPFAVRDEQGIVPIAGLAVVDAQTIRLDLGRALGTKTVVVGAPYACPISVIPFDIAGYRPMLAFTAAVE